jgi:hypothetical protein
LREQGRTFNEISIEIGLCVGRVNTLYYTHRLRPGDEDVPEGMSVLTARDVLAALGIWPSAETAETISSQLMELLRNCRKRKTMPEVSDWLERLDIPRRQSTK